MPGGVSVFNTVSSPILGAVESWAATGADVEAWLKHAKPGDSFVYGRGPSLVRGAAAALVRTKADAGEVRAHMRRAPDGSLEYFVVKKARRPAMVAAPVIDPHMLAVLTVIHGAATNRRRCPSNQAIGEATGLTAFQVKWQLEKLERAGMVRVSCAPTPGEPKFRVVEVVATGCRTAGPAL